MRGAQGRTFVRREQLSVRIELEARVKELGRQPDLDLASGLKGLEKESLRVTPDGFISQSPHPTSIGSALTHPNITTDYSEALLELITPPLPTIEGTLEFLDQLHSFVYSRLDDERLWCASMPCRVGDDDSIPVAWYGSSNVGRMKHVYRLGLGHRYGRIMQTIAGVHFNYSMPESFWPAWRAVTGDRQDDTAFRSAAYFGLIRNFQRFGWLIPYLFGSAPAVCKSFLRGGDTTFDELDTGTLYRPYATSLRMSDVGYKNKNQAGLRISYEGLDEYVHDLTEAIEQPVAEYAAIGVEQNGEWRQLNTNLLQIENEYYSFIRPKQIARSGEKPTLALKRRGVQYIEVRAFDVNPFDELGVNTAQLHFAESFVVMCMLAPSPPMHEAELMEMAFNQQEVATRGRDPNLRLRRHGKAIELGQWANELLEAMQPICELLDAAGQRDAHANALAEQQRNLERPCGLPSSQILAEMTTRDESFFQFAMRRSNELHAAFRGRAPPSNLLEALNDSARASIDEQKAIEAADRLGFSDYLEQYFSQSASTTELST